MLITIYTQASLYIRVVAPKPFFCATTEIQRKNHIPCTILHLKKQTQQYLVCGVDVLAYLRLGDSS